MNKVLSILNQYHWLVAIAAAVLFGLVISAIEYALYRYYLPLVKNKGKVWREVFLSSLHRPFLAFLWLFVISFIIQILIPINNEFYTWINPARQILMLVFIFWFLMRFIRGWEGQSVLRLETKRQHVIRDKTSVHALAQVLRIFAVVVIILMMMKSVGLSISTLLAFGGIGGLAISFAAKDTLANFIGGLMVYWDRPFSVGDWIRSPDRSIEGTVMTIGWRLTTVKTSDKNPLYIPNGVFSTIIVENHTRMSNRRFSTTLGIRYEDADKIQPIVKEIADMLTNHPEIDASQTLFVRLAEFGPSSLNILVYAYTKTTDKVKFQEVQEDVLLKILVIVAKNDAEFAYPTSTVHIPQGVEYFQSIGENGESDDSRNLQ